MLQRHQASIATPKKLIRSVSNFLRPAFIAGIAAVADELDADQVAIGTHGKIGAEAFWNQSVGARLLARTLRPVLLVPV